jgi:hypothetical protein
MAAAQSRAPIEAVLTTPAYDEWMEILGGDDGALFAAMLGRDERSNRLRQSPPYVGMLPREKVAKLNEEAAG